MVVHPNIFDLLKEDGVPTANERQTMVTSLKIQEWPDILLIVDGRPHHLRVLWGVGKPSFSYANRTGLDWNFVSLSCDVVSGANKSTVIIYTDWWDLKDHPVVSQNTVDTEVKKSRHLKPR